MEAVPSAGLAEAWVVLVVMGVQVEVQVVPVEQVAASSEEVR